VKTSFFRIENTPFLCFEGTTWTTGIVKHILYHKDEEMLKKVNKIKQTYEYLEFGPGKC